MVLYDVLLSEFFTKTSINIVLSEFLFYIEFVGDISAMW